MDVVMYFLFEVECCEGCCECGVLVGELEFGGYEYFVGG